MSFGSGVRVGALLGVQIRALEPRTTRIHRQPRVTRFESFRGFERRKAGRCPSNFFGSSALQDCRVRVPSSFLDVARTAPAHPRARRSNVRALASGSTRAIAATGAVAAYLCSAAAATEAGPSTSSDHQGANPIAGANRREVTPLDAPIAAAYPTAANKATAQWRVYTDIARDLSSRGEHEEAGKYLRRALKEAQEGFGKDDPHVAAARNNLAELYRLQRRWDEAERLYEDAARALERHFGPSHPAAATAVHNLGGCKLARGDFRGAYAAYAAAAKKKADALGASHPDYAQTLFHMAEAKRAGGEPEACASLLERSVRVLDERGLGDSAANLRRIERLAQVRGDVLGDHVVAERLRARVLEARERPSRAHGDHEPGKRGFVRDLAMSQRRAAVAAAHGRGARGRWRRWGDEATRSTLRSAVRIHEARLSDAMGLGIPRELLDADDIRPSGLVRGVIELVEQRVNPMFGWARPGAAAEAAAANMRLQLASARLALADVALREEEPRRDEAMEALATEQLARAVGSLQPLAAAAAADRAVQAPRRRERGIEGDRQSHARGRRGPLRHRGHPQARDLGGSRASRRGARPLRARGSKALAAADDDNAGGPAAGRITSEMRWSGCTRRTARTREASVLEAQARALLRELRECVACVAESTR